MVHRPVWIMFEVVVVSRLRPLVGGWNVVSHLASSGCWACRHNARFARGRTAAPDSRFRANAVSTRTGLLILKRTVKTINPAAMLIELLGSGGALSPSRRRSSAR